MKFGKKVPFFEPPDFKGIWYIGSRDVYKVGIDEPVALDCYNMKQARAAARAWMIINPTPPKSE